MFFVSNKFLSSCFLCFLFQINFCLVYLFERGLKLKSENVVEL